MSAGLGMDLVRIERIRRVLEDHPERFRARVFTPTECRDAADRGAGEVASLAARFAAKEAALKAFGTGRAPELVGRMWKFSGLVLEHQFCCSTVPPPIGHVCWDFQIGGSV